jgi:hypothetical protein
MKPLNEDARRKATIQFIGMYAVSLLLVLLLSFFLFRSPSKIYRKQANEYIDFQNQYSDLIKKTRRATSEISDLAQVEKVFTSNSDLTVDSMVKNLKKRIDTEVTALRQDASHQSYALLEKDLSNYLAAFDAIYSYSESLNRLKTNNHTPVNAAQAGNAQNQLRFELIRLRRDSMALAQENRELKSRPNNPNRETSPQPEGSRTAQIAALTNDRNELRAQVRQLQQQLANKDATIAGHTDTITSLRIQVRNAGSGRQLTEHERAKIIFETIDRVINRWPSRRDPLERVCSGIRTTLETIRSDYPDRASLDRKLAELSRLCAVR